MTETILLRNKPELKFTVNNDGFQIVDVSDPKNNGIYLFSQIMNVELSKEKTDWFVSILSFVLEFISEVGGASGRLKNSANLKLKFEERTLKIYLTGADFSKAEKIAELIKNKKTYTQQRV